MVDETGLDEPKVDKTAIDKIAVDKPGPHLLLEGKWDFHENLDQRKFPVIWYQQPQVICNCCSKVLVQSCIGGSRCIGETDWVNALHVL